MFCKSFNSLLTKTRLFELKNNQFLSFFLPMFIKDRYKKDYAIDQATSKQNETQSRQAVATSPVAIAPSTL